MKINMIKKLKRSSFLAAALGSLVGYVMTHREWKELRSDNAGKSDALPADATNYERYVKRALDIAIASVGLVLATPVIVAASVVIFIEDPGDPIFRQKRVGINGTYFTIHKLRSMKLNTDDIPTHLLSKEQQDARILKCGHTIRKYSIDELPQLIDILRGRMSVVGPRPALWNQDDLVAEREKYGANSVRPGLTGLAQISGRDELLIPVKAQYDGEYTKAIRKSSIYGFLMDLRCFIGTIRSVLGSEGVVEGGTGSMSTESAD